MYCTNCGEKLDKDVNFCNHCGKKVKKQKPTFCTKCGGRLNPKNGICMRCLMAGRKNTEVKPKVSNDQIKLNILFNILKAILLNCFSHKETNKYFFKSLYNKIQLLLFSSLNS